MIEWILCTLPYTIECLQIINVFGFNIWEIFLFFIPEELWPVHPTVGFFQLSTWSKIALPLAICHRVINLSAVVMSVRVDKIDKRNFFHRCCQQTCCEGTSKYQEKLTHWESKNRTPKIWKIRKTSHNFVYGRHLLFFHGVQWTRLKKKHTKHC